MASTSDGELLIADRGLRAVVVVDPTTGACQLISSDQRGGGNSFNAPVAVVADTKSYYVIDPGEGAVIRIEPRTGDRTELSARSSRRRVRSHASEAPPLWSSTSG
jgi:streptogramin lyase